MISQSVNVNKHTAIKKKIPSSKQKTGAYILIDANMKLIRGLAM
jgi:hypothetical protein